MIARGDKNADGCQPAEHAAQIFGAIEPGVIAFEKIAGDAHRVRGSLYGQSQRSFECRLQLRAPHLSGRRAVTCEYHVEMDVADVQELIRQR